MNRWALSSALLLSASLSAKTACEIFPIDDAVVVLSQNAEQRDLGNAGCVYEIRTPYLLLKVSPPQTVDEEFKRMAKKGAVAEEGIGSDSFSIVTKDMEAIYVVQGSVGFSMVLSNPGSSTPLPDLMGKMRSIAKRAVQRL